MAKHNRKRFFVDFTVQGALLARTAMYWGFCLFTVATMLIIWRAMTGPPALFVDQLSELWQRFAPALVASLLLLPLVLMDTVRTSNRFAGPIFRLRRTMKALARGESVRPIHFRDQDFWRDMAEDFNAIAARMHDTPSAASNDSEAPLDADQPLVTQG
ncbi:MAG: hypothetical protein GTO53_14615 [Planctomycetales bacterium]|nr:hypothetical protein [Planctomycetales bacterium]NIM10315.1 hypothetical protein [Planctomycetales bacterium]NIN09762.1 hypothetical protein [Planctomycetales bacterium]NIN78885.1 hypothetical protein [Planctomycetales bacterium]NIO36056.1 hypothetical protein [Planctomycetales bacterium]